MEGRDAQGVHAFVRRAVALGASGETLGHLRALDAVAWVFEHRMDEARPAIDEAMRLLPHDDADWFGAAALHAFVGMNLGDAGPIVEVLQALGESSLERWTTGLAATACFTATCALVWTGQRDAVAAFMRRVDAVDGPALDPAFLAWRQASHLFLRYFTDHDLGPLLREARRLNEAYERIGDAWGLAMGRGFCALASAIAGDPDAVALARAAVETSSLRYVRHENEGILALALLMAGRVDEAFALADALVRELPPVAVHTQRMVLCFVHLGRGDAEAAEREARVMLAHAGGLPFAQVYARCHLAEAALLRGQPADALREVDAALALMAGTFAPLNWPQFARLLRAEALLALGERERGREAVREARDSMLRVADTFDDDDARRRYVATSWNVRVMDLARRHLEG
jgi:ATP/maltotriose-dependent transcriptional regulator MalT